MKKSGLLGLMAMGAMLGTEGNFGDIPRTTVKSAHASYKTPMTKKQRKARAASKRASKARRANYKAMKA